MDLVSNFPCNPLPNVPYVGLFGNHHNNWRQWATQILSKNGVSEQQIYDSTDKGWCNVNEVSGDILQPWVNELVRRQHIAMRNAACIVFSLDSRSRTWPENELTATSSYPSVVGSVVGSIFAARCELGWLAGIGKPTFVWIPDDLEGRNYLRAVVSLYDCLVPTKNIYEGCKLAAELLKTNIDAATVQSKLTSS